MIPRSLLALAVLASAFSASTAEAQKPRDVTICELSKAPSTANHAQIRVTGIVEREFEHFVVTDPACPADDQSVQIWLTYGGTQPSGAIYCCPGEGEPTPRAKTLSIDGIVLRLVTDDTLRRFLELMKTPPRARARATLVGTFFVANRDQQIGYGHFGCCSLFVIQRVEQFEPLASVTQPN
jgi:hypothetical protein